MVDKGHNQAAPVRTGMVTRLTKSSRLFYKKNPPKHHLLQRHIFLQQAKSNQTARVCYSINRYKPLQNRLLLKLLQIVTNSYKPLQTSYSANRYEPLQTVTNHLRPKLLRTVTLTV